MIKLLGLAAALTGGAYLTGVFDHHYSRDVGRTPQQVLVGLDSLDITNEPGAPGSDSVSLISHERTPKGIVWVVHSGDKVATRMFADLDAIDNGQRTRVSAHVERGDAPDDFVAPAFRSKAVTLGLFEMALETQLNKLTLPKGDPEHCRQLIEQFRSDAPMQDQMHPDGLSNAIGGTAKAVMRLSAMEAELRRNGCDTSAKADQWKVSNEMGGG